MDRYGIVIEGGEGEGYSAYVPDLPGCVAAAKTLSGVRKLIAEAIVRHIEMMREERLEVPPPTSICETAATVRSTAKCFETAGCGSPRAATMVPTAKAPRPASSSTICRRLGSATTRARPAVLLSWLSPPGSR